MVRQYLIVIITAILAALIVGLSCSYQSAEGANLGFSLIKIDMGDETVPKSITAAHAFWDDVYTRSPFLGAILALSLPAIVIYLIYTWGNIRKSEKALDEKMSSHRAKHKRKKGGGR